jgi:hypothetical protein
MRIAVSHNAARPTNMDGSAHTRADELAKASDIPKNAAIAAIIASEIATPFQWQGKGLHRNHLNQVSCSGSFILAFPPVLGVS